MTLEVALIMLPGLVLGLTLHEFAHAWVASLLGDDFARRQGRVSLNPLRHLSPLGTLAIFLLPFGWGRPVPINLYNFQRPRRDYLLVSLAGPAANLLVVAACLALMRLTLHPYVYDDWRESAIVLGHYLLTITTLLNVILAALNLMPIPPLDGSKVWPCILPGYKPANRSKMQWVSVAILIALVTTGSLDPAIRLIVRSVIHWMPTSDTRVLAERTALANAALNEGQWAEAESLYDEALTINPRSHECLYGRAMARKWQVDWHNALDDVDRAIALHVDPAYYELRASVYRRLGRNAEAAEDDALGRVLRDAFRQDTSRSRQ